MRYQDRDHCDSTTILAVFGLYTNRKLEGILVSYDIALKTCQIPNIQQNPNIHNDKIISSLNSLIIIE